MCLFPIGALFTSGFLGDGSNTFATYTSHDRYLSEYLKPRPAHLTHPFWGNPIVSSSPNMKLNVRFIIQRTGSFWNAKETHPPKKLVSFMNEQIIWGLGLKTTMNQHGVMVRNGIFSGLQPPMIEDETWKWCYFQKMETSFIPSVHFQISISGGSNSNDICFFFIPRHYICQRQKNCPADEIDQSLQDNPNSPDEWMDKSIA